MPVAPPRDRKPKGFACDPDELDVLLDQYPWLREYLPGGKEDKREYPDEDACAEDVVAAAMAAMRADIASMSSDCSGNDFFCAAQARRLGLGRQDRQHSDGGQKGGVQRVVQALRSSTESQYKA